MIAEIIRHTLNFRFDAGTSRGVMTSKDTYFLKLYDQDNPEIFGIGECGPLKGLSPDLEGDLQLALKNCQRAISEVDKIKLENVAEIMPGEYPALQFALETAILDLENGGKRILFDTDFANTKRGIPINGLVWMGDKELMHDRLQSKINEGFDCIKIKVGAINIDDELELIKHIRDQFSPDQITIRLDANGAFHHEDALGILERFSKYKIHSIEQPIMAGDWKAMEKICRQSPIPIALDEELIGVDGDELKIQLLENVKPDYIILKPTVLGGLQKTKEWIELASERSMGWWVTSALESNVGLNAIAQFTANYPVDMPQGLGTGQLFHNNIPSPLYIKHGYLNYDKQRKWDLAILE
jgi:O-succinylbenzoate synthase